MSEAVRSTGYFTRRSYWVQAAHWTKELSDNPQSWPDWLTTMTNGVEMDHFAKMDENRSYVKTKDGWTRVPFGSYIVVSHGEFRVMPGDEFEREFRPVYHNALAGEIDLKVLGL